MISQENQADSNKCGSLKRKTTMMEESQEDAQLYNSGEVSLKPKKSKILTVAIDQPCLES